MGDPWNLSPRQAVVLQALAETGCAKEAARTLGVSANTVEELRRRAKVKMGARQWVCAVVTYDRWKRGQE
jgi:DNA-binding NarL/FixJ family response regulator